MTDTCIIEELCVFDACFSVSAVNESVLCEALYQ